MKKATLLLETILSFIIATSIFTLSSIIYANITKTNQTEFKVTTLQNDLFATKLFISNKLAQSSIKSISSSQITFDIYDKSLFYSKYQISKIASHIIYIDKKLYYNSNLLQDNVTKFLARSVNSDIFIDICIQNSCQEWIF